VEKVKEAHNKGKQKSTPKNKLFSANQEKNKKQNKNNNK